MYKKTEGIILREMRFKETSKILTILTPYHGKISAIARGVYRPKSQMVGTTQPFAYNKFILYKGKNFYYVVQIDSIESYYSIRENINRMLFGSYMLELADTSVLEEEENVKIFMLLKKGLEVLSNTEVEFTKFITAYELKFISFLGYKPMLDSCVVCGEKNFSKMGFSVNKGGVLCQKCLCVGNDSIDIGLDVYRAIKKLIYTPLDRLDSINISGKTAFKIHDIMVKYILHKIDKKNFNSLDIMKSMKNGGE